MQYLIPWWCTDISTSCARQEFQDLRQIWPAIRQHIIDVWQDPSVYVACEGLSDLGNGPNKPTATIIGECSTSCHDGALIYSGWAGENFRIWHKSGPPLGDTSLMSDRFPVCMLLVKGCQTLAMDPTTLQTKNPNKPPKNSKFSGVYY